MFPSDGGEPRELVFKPTVAQSIHIVTLGDSITKGYREGVRSDETFSAFLEAALKKQGLDVKVANVGIGGERTDQALERLDKDVIAKKPQFVTIMYGTNDSYVDKGAKTSRLTVEKYRDNLRALVVRLRKAGIEPVLMTEPRWGDKAGPNGLGEHPNMRLEPFVEACREVARDLKVPLVDHYKTWSRKRDEGVDIGGWTTDQCHPNVAGHRVMAETMQPVIEQAIKR
jgi:acyl-CoA thioesterase-1